MNSRVLLVLLALVATSIATAGIYTWVDEHGVTHYSQSPPPQGAEAVDMPAPVSGERAREAQQRLQRLLREQRQRDQERAVEKSERREKRTAERTRLWGASLTCNSARRVHDKFSTARPIFRLNRHCERVFVSDADRKEVLDAVGELIPKVCAPGYRGDPNKDAESAVRRLRAIDERYLAQRGEPVEYPDFDDWALTSMVDFCRCVPAFLKEMADPHHRTPRSEIEAARKKAARHCPDLR